MLRPEIKLEVILIICWTFETRVMVHIIIIYFTVFKSWGQNSVWMYVYTVHVVRVRVCMCTYWIWVVHSSLALCIDHGFAAWKSVHGWTFLARIQPQNVTTSLLVTLFMKKFWTSARCDSRRKLVLLNVCSQTLLMVIHAQTERTELQGLKIDQWRHRYSDIPAFIHLPISRWVCTLRSNR